MTRKPPHKQWKPEFSDDVQGARRREIIEEHLHWLRNRPREPMRDLSDYPLAQWLSEHRAKLAAERAERLAYAYRNTKQGRARATRTPR